MSDRSTVNLGVGINADCNLCINRVIGGVERFPFALIALGENRDLRMAAVGLAKYRKRFVC